MPLRFTMGDLVTKCRRRVDMKTNQARNDADFKSSISEVYGCGYNIVAESGLRYFETSTTITANGSESYVEATDHLGTVRMALVNADGTEVPLYELMPQEEYAFKGRTGTARRFALVDDRLFLYPKPSSGTYKLYYIPQPPDLSAYADADVVDVVNSHGLQYLVWGTAVVVHGELEGNAILALNERDKAAQRLMEWAALRAFNEPRHTAIDDPDFAAMTRDGEWWP